MRWIFQPSFVSGEPITAIAIVAEIARLSPAGSRGQQQGHLQGRLAPGGSRRGRSRTRPGHPCTRGSAACAGDPEKRHCQRRTVGLARGFAAICSVKVQREGVVARTPAGKGADCACWYGTEA